MKTIYTGYFGGAMKHRYPNPICIAGLAPQWWTGETAQWLAPKKEWFFDWKRKVDRARREGASKNILGALKRNYICRYNGTVLVNMTPKQVFDKLMEITDGEECTLLCYEKNLSLDPFRDSEVGVDFCHRHIVSDFLSRGGITSKEFV